MTKKCKYYENKLNYMKRTILIALCIILSPSIFFGQTKEKAKPGVTFCNILSEDTEIKIKYSDIEKCNEIFPIDENLKIKYFNLSYKKGNGFVDEKIKGNKINKEILKYLLSKKAKQMVIGDIIVLEGTKEKLLPGSLIITFIE